MSRLTLLLHWKHKGQLAAPSATADPQRSHFVKLGVERLYPQAEQMAVLDWRRLPHLGHFINRGSSLRSVRIENLEEHVGPQAPDNVNSAIFTECDACTFVGIRTAPCLNPLEIAVTIELAETGVP
jgi:hypothetical protein